MRLNKLTDKEKVNNKLKRKETNFLLENSVLNGEKFSKKRTLYLHIHCCASSKCTFVFRLLNSLKYKRIVIEEAKL